MKALLKQVPVVGPAVHRLYRMLTGKKEFTGSEDYWKQRYQAGGNSGDGSYRQLAEFKAEVLNDFVVKNHIQSVIEYGSGDGNQLRLAKYPSYIGFDVSPNAVAACKTIFAGDSTKSFKEVKDYSKESADLTLSLDVIYHLVEDAVFEGYMNRLFDSSRRFVIVYASNEDKGPDIYSPHVRHRQFTKWVAAHKPEWALEQRIPNRYPFTGDSRTSSFADFYIFRKA